MALEHCFMITCKKITTYILKNYVYTLTSNCDFSVISKTILCHKMFFKRKNSYISNKKYEIFTEMAKEISTKS